MLRDNVLELSEGNIKPRVIDVEVTEVGSEISHWVAHAYYTDEDDPYAIHIEELEDPRIDLPNGPNFTEGWHYGEDLGSVPPFLLQMLKSKLKAD